MSQKLRVAVIFSSGWREELSGNTFSLEKNVVRSGKESVRASTPRDPDSGALYVKIEGVLSCDLTSPNEQTMPGKQVGFKGATRRQPSGQERPGAPHRTRTGQAL